MDEEKNLDVIFDASKKIRTLIINATFITIVAFIPGIYLIKYFFPDVL